MTGPLFPCPVKWRRNEVIAYRAERSAALKDFISHKLNSLNNDSSTQARALSQLHESNSIQAATRNEVPCRLAEASDVAVHNGQATGHDDLTRSPQ